MYGLVPRGLEEMIKTKWGLQTWKNVEQALGSDVCYFARLQNYPDELIVNLFQKSAQIIDLDISEIFEEFGKYWIEYTAKSGYEHLLDDAGSDLFEVLGNLNELHQQVAGIYPNLMPPAFEVEALGKNQIMLSYFSHRKGLSPMVSGLIKGLAKKFHTNVDVRLLEAKDATSESVKFLITIDENA